MRNTIKFTEEELNFLLRLYQSSEIKGAYKINKDSNINDELIRNLINKIYLLRIKTIN